ncbi:hypothetical protein E1263_03190 [Kribbella antibiotica]|uniref:Uncharacterized protein n=1 Tax=Kribbella antibiotica TaxID=190195 RepID=A0A4R4ZZW0_9ACTN|nr:hypothetical protein [Kribbella antibiotica]TDD62732.1 hypothetical protein E1263_03190 [Kribbella antibiotica]
MAEGGWSRAVRAALFAVVCVLLTVLGHVLMSGTPLPWWVTVGAFVGVFGAGWWFAARERDVPSVTAVAVAAQAVLHGGFTIAQLLSAPAMHGHGHSMGLGSMLGMFGAHLLAGLLSGLWLALGEQAAFRIVRLVAQRVSTSLSLATRAPLQLPRIGLRPVFRFWTMRQWRLGHAIVSRGPPSVVAVF